MSGKDSAADGELLEFLGSVDGEGEGWGEYLEGTDIGRVAPPPVAAEPPPPPPPQAPPGRPPAPGSQP
jgi:hypothetical protein